MRNTLRQMALPITLIALCASASPALASGGGQYHREPPKPTSQQHQRAAAEQASEAAWESLSQQVPDLESGDEHASDAGTVPKSASVQPEKRVCRRVAVEGTRIKRRVCKTVRETVAEDREGKLLSEALLRYKMFQ